MKRARSNLALDRCVGGCNFGNLLFVWDMLFGTAKITRRYPAKVGLPDDLVFGKERWFVEMFYPLFQSRRAHSALARGGRAYAEGEVDGDAAQTAVVR